MTAHAARRRAPSFSVLPAVFLAALLVGPDRAATANADSPPPPKSVEIRSTDISPRIDGAIEEAWLAADSAAGFVQNAPYEKTEPTEPTTVYLLQDADNLYLGFRCYSFRNPPTANYTKDEDFVAARIDPFGSHTTAYYFIVFGSGLFREGLLLDDGRADDESWEGVWYRAVRMYPDRMEVEMKIPFKTIRYKEGLSEWGLQLFRHIAKVSEDDYWTEVTQKDGDLISRWGTAGNVRPSSSGYYFELYPEGFVRSDDYRGESSEVKLKGSLNLKWDLTPQTSLNATAYPDFAQIESDPFSVNLSRYPTYLEEQRPFFVEGTEIFRLSSFPNSGFFQPLNIFYSRRVGKSIDGDAVPIIGGMKLTHKTEQWDLGALGAYTDSYRSARPPLSEPQRRFGVLRAKRRVMGNSNIGILASGMSTSRSDYDYAACADAVFRRGPSQLILQGGMSNHNGKEGWAFTSGYKGFVGRLLTLATYQAVGDSFDVQDIGFVPWAGQQKVFLLSGPYWTFRSGFLRDLYLATGIVRVREPGSPSWSTQWYFEANPSLRRNWGADIEGGFGPYYEYDDRKNSFVRYTGRSFSFNFWGVLNGNHVEGSSNYSYGFNYQRHYLAWQGTNSLSVSYSFVPPLSATLQSNLWVEWDPDNHVAAMWPAFRPRLDWRMSPYVTLSAFNEMVSYAPQTHLRKARLRSDRIGGLFSWNFAPKSWIYLALNDYSALDDTGARPVMKPEYTIAAVKVKYLAYF